MSDIQLIETKEDVCELFDYRNGNLFWKISPARNIPIGRKVGSPHNRGYLQVSYKKKKYFCHRLIFLMHNGFLPAEIDHINGIKDDNRIENLRGSSASQNRSNRKTPSHNRSGVKGVHWNNRERAWVAKVMLNKKVKYVGKYSNLEGAKKAVIKARRELHNEFANHD